MLFPIGLIVARWTLLTAFHRRATRPLILFVTLFSLQPSAVAQTLERIDLPAGSELLRLSPDGDYAVGSYRVTVRPGYEADRPAVWSKLNGLQPLPLPLGQEGGQALDAAFKGSTIVGWVGPSFDELGRSRGLQLCSWHGGVPELIWLGLAGSQDVRVAANGTVLLSRDQVWSRGSVDAPWSQAAQHSLNGIGYDISSDGSLIVGRSGTIACRWPAPLWTSQPLGSGGDAMDGYMSEARGVSPDGTVAVGQEGFADAPNDELPGDFAWWHALERQAPISGFGGVGIAVSDSATVIATSNGGVYAAGVGPVSLTNYLRESGVPGASRVAITEILDMSADGKRILTKGFENGVEGYFLVGLGAFVAEPTVTIESARMVNWKTLRVKVRGEFPKPGGSYVLDSVINGIAIHKEQVEQGDPSSEDIDIDLTVDGRNPTSGIRQAVPRFSRAQRFSVSVRALQAGVSGPAAQKQVTIPLPVIVVQGLFTDITDVEPLKLIESLIEAGYELDGPTLQDYPTIIVFGERFGYKPTSDTLLENARQLQRAIALYTAPPNTYASAVDIIAHSKGGLVSRMYLRAFDPLGLTVRRLIMAGTPHTGSTDVDRSPYAAKTLKELAPTWPWYRRKSGAAFFVPSWWKNDALSQLNDSPIPATVECVLICAVGFETKANLTARLDLYTWRHTDGDGRVTAASELGYQVVNTQEGVALRGSRIRAFDIAPVSEITIQHWHSDMLNGARGVITQILMAP